MKRAVVGIILAVALVIGLLILISKCEPVASEPADGVDSGIVIERSRRVVVVLEDDGERDKHSISKSSRKCPVGSRWPECKK